MKELIKPLEILAIIISLMVIPYVLPKSDLPEFMRETIYVQTAPNKVHALTVELAVTEEEKNFGLMYRRSLLDIHGMFFIYKTPQIARFWMKDTYISLDMVFIDENGVVIKVANNVVPLSKIPVSSLDPVLGVLELSGGTAKELGIKKGSIVMHEIFNNVPKG